MDAVAVRSGATRAWTLRRMDLHVLSIWGLVGAIVLYLAFDGGGYDIIVHSQVGEVVWWIVLVGAVAGVLPLTRFSRAAWLASALFAAFAAWTALGATWSISTERSLADLSLVVSYLGILLLGIAIHRSRRTALPHTIAALGTSIVIVAALAILSRVDPGLFPNAGQTGAYLGSARLSWPVNYWNALAALMAFGIPLLLSLAGSARSLLSQALAAAGLPVLALCGFLTLSRGGAVATGAALIVYFLLASNRLPKLLTVAAAAGGSAILMQGAADRYAFQQGFVNAVARHQGSVMLWALIIVCAGVGLVQVGIGLAVRHATPPRMFVVPRRRAQLLTLAVAVVAIVVAVAAGAPTGVSHLWRDFKKPLSNSTNASVSRFASASGNGRYDVWKPTVDAAEHGHTLDGFGPGTWQLVYLPRSTIRGGYIQDAHSLYVETFVEIGLIGLLILAAFFVVAIGRGIFAVTRSRYEARDHAAGATAALIAFCVSAAFDWVWQVPVLPACFLLLAGALLAPAVPRSKPAGLASIGLRGLTTVLGIACLIAIGVALATASDVRKSQAASTAGDQAMALRDALAAARVEPGASSPQLQAALVLETEHQPSRALPFIRRATNNEPDSWANWFIAARLEAETRHPQAALADFRRAQSLNPRSNLFAHR